MKKMYVVPVSDVVKLNVRDTIAEDVIHYGSRTVDSGDIEGKETDLDDDIGWFSDDVHDYSKMWMDND